VNGRGPAVRTLLESHAKDNFLYSETRVLDGIESLSLEFVTVELRYTSQNVSKGVLQLEGPCQVAVGANTVAAGRMLVLCFSEPLAVNASCSARGIIGFVPWFCARIALDASGVVDLDRILCTSHGGASASDNLICKRLVPAKRPLFALHTAEAASDVEVNVPLPAVLSFALMWQMARKQKKAPTEPRLLLTQKSYKYFGQQSPRGALFSSKAGFLALRNTLALADSEEVAAFVTYQLSDAFRAIMEAECSSDVVLLLHLHSLLVPLSCGIAHLQHLEPASFVEVDFIDHFAAEGRLKREEAEFLANEGAESLCLSFDFGRGGIIADALISIGNAKWREICVLKAGRAYISDRSAMIEIACAVFHAYLRHASGTNCVNSTGDWFDKFRQAMPGVRGLYAETREKMFDDIYLNTLAHKSAAPQVDMGEFRSFSLGNTTSITIPAAISLPELYGIRDTDVIVYEPFVFPSMRLAMYAGAQSSATNAAVAYGAQSDEASLLQLKNRAPPARHRGFGRESAHQPCAAALHGAVLPAHRKRQHAPQEPGTPRVLQAACLFGDRRRRHRGHHAPHDASDARRPEARAVERHLRVSAHGGPRARAQRREHALLSSRKLGLQHFTRGGARFDHAGAVMPLDGQL
jgi:hypothetical protein